LLSIAKTHQVHFFSFTFRLRVGPKWILKVWISANSNSAYANCARSVSNFVFFDLTQKNCWLPALTSRHWSLWVLAVQFWALQCSDSGTLSRKPLEVFLPKFGAIGQSWIKRQGNFATRRCLLFLFECHRHNSFRIHRIIRFDCIDC
jgi:hypothetical protein